MSNEQEMSSSGIPFVPEFLVISFSWFSSQNKKNVQNWNSRIIMTKREYKDNLIERMGGEASFDFLVIAYCERILEDSKLKSVFGSYNLKTLSSFQKDLLMAAFLDPESASNGIEPLRRRIAFRHELMNINDTHFDALERHFLDALRDCWLGKEDFELCKKYFGELQPIFFKEEVVEYKDDLINRMGGEENFDFLVISFSERIQDDRSLSNFFGNFDLKSLTYLMKELLLAALLEPNTKNDVDALKRKVSLRFHRLFEMGFNERHFDVIKEHLSGALHDCWSRDDVIEPCKEHFAELRDIFQTHGKAVLRMEITQKRQEEEFSQSLREYGSLLGVSLDADRLIQSEKTANALRKGAKEVDVPFWRRKARTAASGSSVMNWTKKQKQTRSIQ